MAEKLTKTLISKLSAEDGGPRTIWDTSLHGFGVRIGKTRKTYVFEGKARGSTKRRKFSIGVHGVHDAKGQPWSLARARDAARVIHGQLKAGIDPKAEREKQDAEHAGGPTLREGLELHLANMAKRNRSPRSIATVRASLEKHLAAWLDRPMAELTSVKLDAEHERIIASTAPKAGSVNPPGHAAAKRVVVYTGTIWEALNKKHQGALGGWNPAKGVQTHSLEARKARLGAKTENSMPWPLWYERVEDLGGVRRDLQLLALFTGVRSEGLRNIRWEDIDLEKGLLTVRVTKGNRPYDIPLCQTHRDIFARRKAENAELFLFDDYSDDEGWVFPTRTRAKPFAVVPVAEPKEWRVIKDERVQWLPGLHPLRRTYASVAAEAGVDEFTIKILMNHKLAGVTGKHYTQLENLERFAKAQATIETALWECLKPSEEKEAAA